MSYVDVPTSSRHILIRRASGLPWPGGVPAPVNTVLPAITGTPTVGQTLTASTGTWSNSPTSYAYQWKRAGVAIGSATASTYTQVAADTETLITVTVTATNAGGSANATSASVGPVAAIGGAVLLAGETNGLAVDFTYATDVSRVAVKTAGVVAESGIDTFFQNTGTSPKQVFDVSGNLVWAPHNILLRSEDFTNASWVKSGTPVVTEHTVQDDDAGAQENISQPYTGHVTGASYTLSFWVLKDAVTTRFPAFSAGAVANLVVQLNTNTGAISVSTNTFVSASASVEDVGTHWKIKLIYVAEGASVTMRIYASYAATFGGVSSVAPTGPAVTVDRVQLNRGAVPTEYLVTTSAARYGLAVDYDPLTHVCKGMLVEQAAVNLLLNNATLSTQSVTVTAVAHTLSFWGTGTITLSGVSTAGPLVGTGVSNRVSLTFTPTAGSLTLTVTGTVSRAQLETQAHATSPVPTFGTTQSRAADNVTALLSTIPALGSEYSMYGRWAIAVATNASASYALTDGTANEQTKFTHVSAQTRLFVIDGGVTGGSIIGLTLSPNVLYSAAARIKLNDCAMSMNGGAVTTDTSVTLPTVTEFRFGGTGTNAAAGASFYIAKMMVVPRAWSDAELPVQSAVT